MLSRCAKVQAPALWELAGNERARLRRAFRHAEDVRVCRRAQALLLVAKERALVEVAHETGLRRPTGYFWLQRYVQSRRTEALR